MAKIEIEIADELYQEVEDAFVEFFHYQDMIDDGSGLNIMIENPETRAEFIARKLKLTISDVVRYARQKREESEPLI